MFTSFSSETGRVSCTPLSTSLCVTRNGNRFFPTDKVFVSDTSVTKCFNGQGRELVPETQIKSTNSTTGKDDISLCDVLDNNVDVIYDPVNNYVYTKDLSKSTGLYTFASMLILVVVVLTAEAVSQRARSRLVHNIIAWIMLTVVALLMFMNADGRMHPLITTRDRTFILISLIYITTSTAYWLYSVSTATPTLKQVSVEIATVVDTHTDTPVTITNIPETQRDGVNAMIGSIHFTTCVIYGTPDNTYVSGFFFVFLFRCMQKMYDSHHKSDQWTTAANTVIVLDILYTVTIFSFGVLPHFTSDSDTTLYAAAQFVVCDAIAAACVVNVDLNASPPPPSARPATGGTQPESTKPVAGVMPTAVGPEWTTLPVNIPDGGT